jgi:hypothetical protein
MCEARPSAAELTHVHAEARILEDQSTASGRASESEQKKTTSTAIGPPVMPAKWPAAHEQGPSLVIPFSSEDIASAFEGSSLRRATGWEGQHAAMKPSGGQQKPGQPRLELRRPVWRRRTGDVPSGLDGANT